jgi:hypothetical protein
MSGVFGGRRHPLRGRATCRCAEDMLRARREKTHSRGPQRHNEHPKTSVTARGRMQGREIQVESRYGKGNGI